MPCGRARGQSASRHRPARSAGGLALREILVAMHPRPGGVPRRGPEPPATPRLLCRIRTGPTAVFLGALGVGRARPAECVGGPPCDEVPWGDRSESAPEATRAELEQFLDRLQPGWQTHVVTRRFLPGMTVASSLPRAEEGGLQGRPDIAVPGLSNVFLAGDWVGGEGMLADASAASASEAAGRVLAVLSRTPAHVDGGLAHASS